MAKRELIYVDDTRFIFRTNFSGDANRDTFGSTIRRGNIIIPTAEQAEALIEMGVNVKTTKPREGYEDEYVPEFYAPITLSYRKKDGSLNTGDFYPEVFLVTDGCAPVLLDENTASQVDFCEVKNVNVILRPYHNQNTGRTTLYIHKMYVEQNEETDPYANRYRSDIPEEVPFN